MLANHHTLCLRRWTKRAAQIGWSQRVVVALDNSTLATARLLLAVGAHTSCAVRFFRSNNAVVAGRERRAAGRMLPVFTGLAKFSVLHLLVAGGHDSITLSEMDVFWFFAPPWAMGAFSHTTASLLCLDNYPAATQESNAANIGLIHVRRPHTADDGFACRFFAHLVTRWRERLLATAGEVALVVGEDQLFFNRELRGWPDEGERTRSFALLNRSRFANTRLLEAYGRGRYKVPRPTGEVLRLAKAGLPHAHLEASLVTFHAISVPPIVKMALLLRLYAGNLTRSKFAKNPWHLLV